MKKNNKFKEILSNKEAVIGICIALGMIVIAVLQFVFR